MIKDEIWYASEPFGLDEYWYAYIMTGEDKQIVAQVKGKTIEQCKERIDFFMESKDSLEDDYNERDLNT